MTNNKDNQLYVAKDKNGASRLYVGMPVQKQTTKGTEYENWDWCTDADKMIGYIPNDVFPDLKWEDGPIPVKIVNLQIDEKKLAKKTLEEALAAKFCGFIPEGETPGMTDLNIFEYAYKLGVINTLGLFKMPKDLMTIAQMEELKDTDTENNNNTIQ